MGMIVQHNMASMNANRNLGVVSGALSKSTEKLSSGYRINRAGDDAAGLAISEKMRGQIRGLDQASSNAQDGISLIQTAEGALTETHNILQRMRELAVQASSDTNTDDDRTQIQTEINQLTEEVDRIANTTEFNTKKLIDGSRTGAVVEKSGKINVEGTFGNSNVSASITTDGSAKQAYTDVIRVEIKEDFTQYGKDAGALTATEAEVNGYKTLAESIGENKAEISALINKAGMTFTQAEIDAYITATKDTLKSGADSTTAQTNAWDTIYGKIPATTTAGADVVIGGATVAGGTAQAAVGAALKEALDNIAKQEIEMETNAKYQEMAAVEVDDVTNPGTKKTLETIMNDMVDKSSDYSSAVKQGSTTGILGANGVAEANLQAAIDEYKEAYKTAVASGIAADDAMENDAVVEARQAVYDLFETAFNKNAAADNITIPAGGLTIGDETFAAGNANIAKVAGAVFDNLLDKAQDLALEEINQDNALSKIDTSGVEPEKAYTITDLFGNGEGESADKFTIASTLDDDKNLTITLKNGENQDTVITIKNADKLKAGDVITVSSEKYTATQPAATGKDALRLQVGANAGQEVSLGINSMKASDLNIVQTKAGYEGAALNVTDQADASLAVNAYDMAIQKVSAERAKMGAIQNRLEHTISNLDTSAENLQTAESRIRDTDMAEEMTQYSKNNILMQAGQSMLAQANQSTQGVLSLLQ